MSEAKNIYQRLFAIMEELKPLVKTGEAPDAIGGWKFSGINDVLEAVNPLLLKHGVLCLPDRETTYARDDKIGTGMFYWNYINVDDQKDRHVVAMPGDGAGKDDKVAGKAATYSLKYAHISTFQLRRVDEDDPDASQKPELGVGETEEERSLRTISLYNIKASLSATLGATDDRKKDKDKVLKRVFGYYSRDKLRFESPTILAIGEKRISEFMQRLGTGEDFDELLKEDKFNAVP